MDQQAVEVLKTASGYGPETFICVLVLLMAGLAMGVYIIKVLIPESENRRETNTRLAEAIEKLSANFVAMSGSMASHAASQDTIVRQLNRLVAWKRAATNAIAKMSREAKVDIQGEIAEMIRSLGVDDIDREVSTV
jgi:ABC-type nitrate/sulfonate/bicarbonate transport system ATPase subunit